MEFNGLAATYSLAGAVTALNRSGKVAPSVDVAGVHDPAAWQVDDVFGAQPRLDRGGEKNGENAVTRRLTPVLSPMYPPSPNDTSAAAESRRDSSVDSVAEEVGRHGRQAC